jgi:hypothetical protein
MGNEMIEKLKGLAENRLKEEVDKVNDTNLDTNVDKINKYLSTLSMLSSISLTRKQEEATEVMLNFANGDNMKELFNNFDFSNFKQVFNKLNI